MLTLAPYYAFSAFVGTFLSALDSSIHRSFPTFVVLEVGDIGNAGVKGHRLAV